MADDHTNSASTPLESDPNMNYKYKALGLPSMASPGPGLPGYKSPVDGTAQRKQAAAAWQAEQNAAQAKSDAQAKKDKAPPRGKRSK
jgi:hypothetical protein